MLLTPLSLLALLPVAFAQANCPTLEFIFARATTEPPTGISNRASAAQFESAAARVWSKGYGAAGHSIYTNVTALIPGSVGYPVHYPASFSGCTSEDKGVSDLIARLNARSAACPNTLFALGGHSQGGVVTVRAIPKIPAAVLRKVIAVTMVGSPACPSQVAGRCKSYCNQGDSICSGTGSSAITGRCSSRRIRSADPEAWALAEARADVGLDGIFGRSVDELEKRVADCSQPEPAEKGHKAAGRQSAHMAYNEDGFYVKAAACYILRAYAAAAKKA